MGLIEDRTIAPIVDGVLSVMRDLGMAPGEPTPTQSPLFIRERAYATSEHDGVWEPDPLVEAGQYVAKAPGWESCGTSTAARSRRSGRRPPE